MPLERFATFGETAVMDDRTKKRRPRFHCVRMRPRRRASPFLKCNQWSTVNDPSGGASDEQRNNVPVEHHRRTRGSACRTGPGRRQTGCQKAGEEEGRQETGGEEVSQESGEEGRQEGRPSQEKVIPQHPGRRPQPGRRRFFLNEPSEPGAGTHSMTTRINKKIK